MKIKILSYHGEYHDDYDRFILHDVTSWDEVTEDEYKKLVGWVQLKNQEGAGDYSERYVIFREDHHDYKTRIADYLTHIEDEEKKTAERKAAREAARQLRLAKKQKLAEKEEKALLEQLKNKYESQ